MPIPALLLERLARQRLADARFASPKDATAGLLAVQSQDLLGAAWALGLRTGAPRHAVMAAYDAGLILRTHVLRPTWHLVAREDLRWLLALTAPRVRQVIAGSSRAAGLDARTRTRATDVMARALEGGRFLTRQELVAALVRRGITAEKQRLGLLAMHAELDGVIVSGPMRGTSTTYALAAERVPRTRLRERDEALGELAGRYFATRGPATAHDCAWWSGLTLADVRRGIAVAGEAVERRDENGSERWSGPRASLPRLRGPVVHFLSNFDEYAVAYADRSALLGPRPLTALGSADRLLATHLVIADGTLVGTWRRTIGAGEAALETRIALPLSVAARRALAAAAGAFGRFLGLAARVETRQRRPSKLDATTLRA